jgi:hypothetical protein
VAKKRRKKLTAEEWVEIKARSDRMLAKLQERIDYHTAKLREQFGPDYEPDTLEQRLAYWNAVVAAEEDRRAG